MFLFGSCEDEEKKKMLFFISSKENLIANVLKLMEGKAIIKNRRKTPHPESWLVVVDASSTPKIYWISKFNILAEYQHWQRLWKVEKSAHGCYAQYGFCCVRGFRWCARKMISMENVAFRLVSCTWKSFSALSVFSSSLFIKLSRSLHTHEHNSAFP